jgi:PAS domain S-box-containing protein
MNFSAGLESFPRQVLYSEFTFCTTQEMISRETDHNLNADRGILPQYTRDDFQETAYGALLEKMPVAIYEIDPKATKFYRMNNIYTRLTGYSTEELSSMSPQSMMDEEGKSTLLERIEQKLAGNEDPSPAEIRMCAKSGKWLWLLVLVSQIQYDKGVSAGVLIAALELKGYEERLEQMVVERTEILSKANTKLSQEIRERIEAGEMLVKQTRELENYQFRLQESVKERTAELESNYIKLAREIVERRQMEKALSESERKLQEVSLNIPGIIFQLRVEPDGSNTFTYLSGRAPEIFDLPAGLSTKEWNLTDHIHPDDKSGFLSSIAQAVNENTKWNYEGRILKTDGEIKWFQGIFTPPDIGDANVLDGIILDVTDMKRTERTLSENEKVYRDLADSLPEPIFILNMDLRVIYCNKRTEDLAGIKALDVTGRSFSVLFPETTALEKLEKSFREVLMNGKLQKFKFGITIGGKTHFYIFSVSRNPNGISVVIDDRLPRSGDK